MQITRVKFRWLWHVTDTSQTKWHLFFDGSGSQICILDILDMSERLREMRLPKGIEYGIPIGSMYAIYGNIYHQYTPNVSIYTIHGSYGIDKFLLLRLGNLVRKLGCNVLALLACTTNACGNVLCVDHLWCLCQCVPYVHIDMTHTHRDNYMHKIIYIYIYILPHHIWYVYIYIYISVCVTVATIDIASSCCINARMFAVTHSGLSQFFLCRCVHVQVHSGSVCKILHTEPTYMLELNAKHLKDPSIFGGPTNLIWGTQTSFAERSFKKGHWKAPMSAVKGHKIWYYAMIN